MVYWKQRMMGPRPLGCWKGLNGRRKRSKVDVCRDGCEDVRMAAMELETLNACEGPVGEGFVDGGTVDAGVVVNGSFAGGGCMDGGGGGQKGFRNFAIYQKDWAKLTTKDIGKLGEDAAMEYLLHRGFKLRRRNWFCCHLELDLVMEDARGIHIVEVRTRKAPMVVAPEATVDHAKRRRLIAAADAYVRSTGEAQEVFFDVVSVVLGRDGDGRVKIYSLEYIENAFLPLR